MPIDRFTARRVSPPDTTTGGLQVQRSVTLGAIFGLTRVLPALALVCCGGCIVNDVAPDTPLDTAPVSAVLSAASGARPESGTLPLTVLSYNMEHESDREDLSILAGYLKDLDTPPEFILCQEVMFRSGPDGLGNTAAVLAHELGYASRGTKRRSDAEGCAIISRYPFSHYDELHLKARTSPLLLDFARVSVMGEFEVPGVGRVRVVSVHFAYQDFEHHVRKKQLRETVEWMAQREREVSADVTILGGDFNMKPYRPEFAPMLDLDTTGGLVFHNANSLQPTRGPKGNPTRRIDYIFVAAPDRDIGFRGETLLFADGLVRRDGRRWFVSDHVPVLHQYTVGGPELVTVTR